MNACRRSGIDLYIKLFVILMVGGMAAAATFTVAAHYPTNAGGNTNPSPPRAEEQANRILSNNTLSGSKHPIELKLDEMPYAIPHDQDPTSFLMTEADLQLAIDDGFLETAIGVNDASAAYQFIWFNRFTPQPSDFPFVLDEIQVLFDNTIIETNITIGDTIELAVFLDADGDPTNGATHLGSYFAEILAIDGVTWSTYSLSPPLTLTDPGDVLIGVINRYVNSGISEPSWPAALDTTNGKDRSWIGWWITDPPSPPELPPNDTLLLMSGSDAGNWLIRGYGSLPTKSVYLPLIVKEAISPAIPTMADIENADGDGEYTVSWSASNPVTAYTLEEDDNAAFTSPTVIYNGLDTFKAIAGKPLGDYYYRVRAENGSVLSGWSEAKMASVTQVPQLICETHEFGTGGVSIQVPTSGLTYHFTALNTMVIETLEVKSFLKSSFPTYVYVAVGINDTQLANRTHSVIGIAYTPYTITRSVSALLKAGDDIYYYASRSPADPVAYLGWGNTIKLCGR